MPEPRYSAFTSDLSSFDESINNVDESTKDFMWKRHRILSLFIFIPSITFALLFAWLEIVYFDWAAMTDDSAIGALMFVLLPLLPIAIYYLTIQARMAALFHKQLAEAIGFTYAPSASIKSVQGRIFEFGSDQMLREVYTGFFGAYPGRFYTYIYLTGHGRNRKMSQFTVGEIDYGRTLPRLLLRPKRNQLYRRWQFDGSENIPVEGGFDDYFDYYAEKGKRIEALQVLEPTIMALFHDTYPDFGFETCGTRLYVFCPLHGIRTKQGFIGLHALLLALSATLAGELHNVSTELSEPDIDQS